MQTMLNHCLSDGFVHTTTSYFIERKSSYICLIAYQPPGSEPLREEWLRNGWTANPHGGGFMFARDGKLVIRKGFYKFREFKEAYDAAFLYHGAESPFIVHFRWATHGGHEVVNCHPHELANGDAGLVHNGILDQFQTSWNSKISDTVLFCRTVLAMRPAEQLVDEAFNGLLAEMIGPHNKFAIMDKDGNVSIVNADQGEWDGPYWFSNLSYLPPVKIKSVGAQSADSLFTAPGEDEYPVVWELTDDEWNEYYELESRITEGSRGKPLTSDEWGRYVALGRIAEECGSYDE